MLDGRSVDYSRQLRYYLDFQLPIDDLEVWCRYAHPKYFEIYVNGILVPDLEGSKPPRISLEHYRTFAGFMAFISFIVWMLMLVGIALGWFY